MSTRTPLLSPQSQPHSYWGSFAYAVGAPPWDNGSNLLPGAPGNPLSTTEFAKLETGDIAATTDATSANRGLFVCIDAPTASTVTWRRLDEPGPAAATFFALMPGDNAATIAIGAAIQFPQDGATVGAAAPTRSAADTFQINYPGVYLVSYQASVDEAGQLSVWVNGVAVAASRAGRATGTNQISNSLLLTLALGDLITVRNDASATALTMTPSAGGTGAVSATLTISLVG